MFPKVLFNRILKRSYTKLKDESEKSDDSFHLTMIQTENKNDEYIKCLDCLLEELKMENWKKNPEKMFLKMAYEKKIIQNIATSLSELNKEDKKNLEQILALYNFKYDYSL